MTDGSDHVTKQQRYALIGGAGRMRSHVSWVEPDNDGLWWPVCGTQTPSEGTFGSEGTLEEMRRLASCVKCQKVVSSFKIRQFGVERFLPEVPDRSGDVIRVRPRARWLRSGSVP